MFLLIQAISRLVLILLAALSVWSISIMIDRRRLYRSYKGTDSLESWKAKIKDGQSASLLQNNGQPENSLRAGALRLLLDFKDSDSEAIDRAMRAYLTTEKGKLEKGLTILATLGSNAPFIGLFGTVLGIIHAFGELSQAQVGTQAVMAGISEALIATAIGLLVAIPAVVAFNAFQKQVRTLLTEGEVLRDHFIACKKRSS